MSAGNGKRAIVAAAGANCGIAVCKAGAWLLTGSAAMLAEALHSLADTSNQLLLMIGAKRAARPADDDHPFGYGHLRYLYAFIVAIVLFSAGGLFALHEAWHKFIHPQPITQWHWVPVAVLIVSIALEGNSLRIALAEAKKARGQVPLMSYVRAARAPEIPVVILEDIAALVGLIFALGGVSATLLTGDGRYDGIGSGAIGVLLVIVAVFLARETASLLVGESATGPVKQAIRDSLPGGGVRGVVDMRTMHIGPEEVVVAAKIAVGRAATGAQIAAAIDQAEARVRAQLPTLTLRLYLEPVLADSLEDHRANAGRGEGGKPRQTPLAGGGDAGTKKEGGAL